MGTRSACHPNSASKNCIARSASPTRRWTIARPPNATSVDSESWASTVDDIPNSSRSRLNNDATKVARGTSGTEGRRRSSKGSRRSAISLSVRVDLPEGRPGAHEERFGRVHRPSEQLGDLRAPGDRRRIATSTRRGDANPSARAPRWPAFDRGARRTAPGLRVRRCRRRRRAIALRDFDAASGRRACAARRPISHGIETSPSPERRAAATAARNVSEVRSSAVATSPQRSTR